MVQMLRHQPSYVVGTCVDPAAGVYVGWVERTRPDGEAVPISNERGDVTLIFSGQEFPDPGTPHRLRQRGHALSDNRASYLVHLYEDECDFPRSLNGHFHGILTDRARGTVTLFNDRYGMHRLYYHESKEAFYFAAEAKAILAVRPELRSLDPRGAAEFITCSAVLENRTLFKDVHVLPPGSAWVFRNAAIDRRSTYFEPSEWENQGPLDRESYYQQLKGVFSQNLPRYFDGHGLKVGMSLTGGLDTRMMMAWWKGTPGSLPCYTFGSPFRDCQDVIVARRVARVCQQPHQVIAVGNEFLSQFPRYVERTVYLSDGCAGVNRSPDLFANERAAQIAPIRMTGNYGSEILRGLRAFKPVEPAAGLFHPELMAHAHDAAGTYAALVRGHAVTFTAFRQAPWYQYGLLALEQTQLALRSPFLDNDVVRTAYRAPTLAIVKSDIFEDNDDCVRLIADGNTALRRIPTDRGLAGSPRRFAALPRAALEFTFKAEYAYDYGMPQWLARIDRVLSPLRPERLFLGRHKFYHFRVWYRDALAGYVRAVLLDPRALSRPYLDRRTLESVVLGHLRGGRNFTTELHKLLTLELVHQLFLDAPATIARSAAAVS